jgi:hypothetical protein
MKAALFHGECRGMPWFFTARSRFSPETNPDGWKSYQDFSGFHHIDELVSADSILCSDLIDEILAEDWQHNVQADHRVTWFTDVDYLKQRIHFDSQRQNILALFERPETPMSSVPTDFEPCGFDILDSYDSISVLTNCGPFRGIFAASEVNRLGLLSDLDRADDVAKFLRLKFPNEDHCRDCRVWRIARYASRFR